MTLLKPRRSVRSDVYAVFLSFHMAYRGKRSPCPLAIMAAWQCFVIRAPSCCGVQAQYVCTRKRLAAGWVFQPVAPAFFVRGADMAMNDCAAMALDGDCVGRAALRSVAIDAPGGVLRGIACRCRAPLEIRVARQGVRAALALIGLTARAVAPGDACRPEHDRGSWLVRLSSVTPSAEPKPAFTHRDIASRCDNQVI